MDMSSGMGELYSPVIPAVSETCTVVALLSGRLSDRESHAQVHVTVIDENDNAPELVYPEEPRVCENAAPGKVRQEEGFSLNPGLSTCKLKPKMSFNKR